jgi:hypothetical protein
VDGLPKDEIIILGFEINVVVLNGRANLGA